MKTDKNQYNRIHKALYRKFGKANKCENCGTLTAKRYEWANKTGDYEDINDFWQLCPSCHHRADNNFKNLDLSKMKPRICEKCGEKFQPKNGRQRFCGDLKSKIGCAYLNLKEYTLSQYYKHRERRMANKNKPVALLEE